MDVKADWIVFQTVRGGYRSLKAMRKIRQGETLYDMNELKPLDKADKYSIEISPGIHLDCEYVCVGAINHSCDPNAAVRGLRIVAFKCIEAGDEITIDYKRTETTLAEPFDCKCGAKNCRGRIE